MKALVIRQPWIGMILRGEKTWEMRKQRCTYRGLIALIEQGTGTVVGTARIVDDLPSLTESELRARRDKHGIPDSNIAEVMERGWVRPWVLGEVERLSKPVRYDHPSGAVTWVNLSPHEEAAVRGATTSLSFPAPALASTERALYAEHSAMVRRILGEVGDAANETIPADAFTSVKRRGSKLYIDVAWNDEQPIRHKRARPWVKAIGIFAALVCMFSQAAFVIHLFLGMMSSSISALSAFKWAIPAFIGAAVAGLFRQGHLLKNDPQER